MIIKILFLIVAMDLINSFYEYKYVRLLKHKKCYVKNAIASY